MLIAVIIVIYLPEYSDPSNSHNDKMIRTFYNFNRILMFALSTFNLLTTCK